MKRRRGEGRGRKEIGEEKKIREVEKEQGRGEEEERKSGRDVRRKRRKEKWRHEEVNK